MNIVEKIEHNLNVVCERCCKFYEAEMIDTEDELASYKKLMQEHCNGCPIDEIVGGG